MKIHQSPLTPTLKRHIYEGFKKDALESMGKNGLEEDPIALEMRKGNELVGCIVVHLFWGQLHIKYLFVEEPYRRQGIGTQLLEEAFEFGKKRGCTFAFVETMSFQAPAFYEKLGFKKDLVREGFDKGLSFQYLSKKLQEGKNPKIEIRSLEIGDSKHMEACFALYNWVKPQSLFEGYLKEKEIGERLIWVAFLEKKFVGYVTLKWKSSYDFFRQNQIPEIMDLNVLPPYQGRGIGSKLLEVAEKEAGRKGDQVGLGVGLTGDYGKAQRLYIKRGYLPDGLGITHRYQRVVYGESSLLDDDLILWFAKKVS